MEVFVNVVNAGWGQACIPAYFRWGQTCIPAYSGSDEYALLGTHARIAGHSTTRATLTINDGLSAAFFASGARKCINAGLTPAEIRRNAGLTPAIPAGVAQ
jgi:hypothetical protein